MSGVHACKPAAHVHACMCATRRPRLHAQGLDEVYKGGAHEDRLARSIEMALTTKDEFGQVMTPKERFRQLCYE